MDLCADHNGSSSRDRPFGAVSSSGRAVGGEDPMMGLAGISFAAPWVLVALLSLPVLWWLLRLMPPAPKRQLFPAIRLLFGLRPVEETPFRTPWWLLLLRLVIAGLIILALAHPLEDARKALAGNGPLLLVVDNG